MNTKKVYHSTDDNSGNANQQDHLYLNIHPRWFEWVIDQPKSVNRLFHQCWISDPYGTNAQSLKTDLAGTTLKVAKKVLSDIGLFEFIPVKDDKTGKILSWKVKNLHGGRVNKNHREKPILKSKTIDSNLVENLDDPSQNTYIPPSKILTTPVENLDDPSEISTTLVKNSDDPRQDFRLPPNAESLTRQAFEVVEKPDSLYLYSSKNKDREISISAIIEQQEKENQNPVVEVEPPLFRGEVQEGELIEEPILESFTMGAVPLDAPQQENNGQNAEDDEIHQHDTSMTSESLLSYANESPEPEPINDYDDNELNEYFARLRELPKEEPILESFTVNTNPQIQSAQDLNMGWENSPTNIPKEYLLEKEENQVQILTEATTTLDATSSIDNQEEYETFSGGTCLSNNALNEQLAYWNSLNDGTHPTIESMTVEPRIEPAIETIKPLEESNTNNVVEDAATLEAPQQLESWEEEEIIQFNQQLANGYQWYQIPDTDMVTAMPVEDYKSLIGTARQYLEQHDLEFDCWQFIEYQKGLALNFLQELKTFGLNIKIISSGALEAFVRTRKAYAIA